MKIDLDKIEQTTKQIDETEVFDTEFLDKCIQESSVRAGDQYTQDVVILKFIDGSYETPVMSLSNISLTLGAAKAKKTFYTTMVASAFIAGGKFLMQGDLMGRKLLYIDTEQSKFHCQKIVKRLVKLTGIHEYNWDFIALRRYAEPELRLAIIKRMLDANFGAYQIVIIDGVVDLVYDFNNLKESTVIINKLMSWSEVYDCHINFILHMNKDGINARGHLGSIAIQKAESVFKVTKQDETFSEVSCQASRNKAFKSFEFFINNDGLPVRQDHVYEHLNTTKQSDSDPF